MLGCGDDDLGGLALTERTRHGLSYETREDVSELVARGESCQRQLLTRLRLELVKVRQDELPFGQKLPDTCEYVKPKKMRKENPRRTNDRSDCRYL